MKKIILFLSLCLLLLPGVVLAEEIDFFNVEAEIKADSSVVVEERIVYDFGERQRHGIYRDIPYKYAARGGNYSLAIKVLGVTGSGGEKINYQTSRSNGRLQIKIGDADKYVSGVKEYNIKYEVGGAINFFENQDEFYWNVTGNEWQVPILKAVAQIKLPTGIDMGQVQTNCFTGAVGSTAKNCNMSASGSKVLFGAQNLTASQGLTVVVGLPKGAVAEPGLIDKIWKIIKDNLILLLPIIVFIFLFNYWRQHGRDSKDIGTVVPEYEPPEGILVAEAGVVMDEKMDSRDLSATIIDLAVKGYLKLKKTEKKALGLHIGKDWVISRQIKSDDSLIAYERVLLNALFNDSMLNEVSLSKLKNEKRVGRQIKEMKNSVYENVVKKGWFEHNPENIRRNFIAVGSIVLFILFFGFQALAMATVGVIGVLSVAVSAAMFIVFGIFMPKKTEAGNEMKRKLLGFKMFLGVTERDRVKFHFSPEKNPEKFVDYLPWAIMFKVEKEWANVFAGIDMVQPDWYEGVWAGHFTALVLVDSMSSFDSSFKSAMAGAGAAKGASGFGGGGFSGGGFGGGGGGSW